MKNENKVTIKNRKIMIHKFSRYLLTLVALLTMTTGAWAEDGELLVTITPDGSGNPTYSVDGIATLDLGGAEYNSSKGCWRKFGGAAYLTVTAADGINVTKVKFTTNKNDSWEDTDAPYQVQLDGGYALNASGSSIGTGDGIKKIEVFGTPAADVEVTISDDQTEAEFDMPSYDATLEYDIVRNMASNMTVSVGDGEDGYRIRIKKDGETFVPAEMTLQQMMALYTVHDATEQKDLVFYGDGKVCDISIFAVDDDDQPTGDAIAFTALTPGRYVAIATAVDDSNYAGTTAPSNIFQLYQGYEVEIAGGEFATFFKDEAIYVEDEDVQLFSITAVGENTATATQFDVIPANKAMLVKNNSAEPKTVLLIPTETDPLSFTWYDGFVGTLEATTILASDATTDRYAFNGKQFVRVKNDLAVGATKAWLEIPAANNARIINISFEETTGIHGTNWANEANGTWYDLNGRKLDAVPTKKGVYILNGRKVVVK